MWAGRNINVVWIVASVLCLGDVSRCAAAEPAIRGVSSAGPVVISLRSRVQVESRVIRMVDIAQVTGGDAPLRERVQALDLEDPLSSGESLAITPMQVEFRLRLAGIDAQDVSIRGTSVRVTTRGSAMLAEGTPQMTTAATNRATRAVSPDDGSLEHAILKAAEECIIAKLPWKADAVEIRLAQPLSLPREVSQGVAAAGYECRAELRTTGPAVGRVPVRVVAEAPGRPSFDVQVQLDVRHFDDVVLTTRTLERGRIISAADVYVDRQDVTEMADYCSHLDPLIGATTRKSLRALLPLRTADVEPVERSANAILIKRRERVKMIARTGAVSVTVLGEALQDGRVGESIRLRNVNSDAVVQGRVTGTNEVEISF